MPGQEDAAYSSGSYSPSPTTADATDPRYFPQTNYFPPPPTQAVENQYPPYNPADYGPPPPNNMPPPTGYTPPPVNPEPGNPYARPDPRYRRPDDNVSAQPPPEHMHARGGSRLSPDHENVSPANDLPRTDRLNASPPLAPDPVPPPSSKSVQFDLHPKEVSPDRYRSSEGKKERSGDRSKRHDSRDKRKRRRDESPDSDDSGDTIELPPRFDQYGRRTDDDPLADKLESVLSGLFL